MQPTSKMFRRVGARPTSRFGVGDTPPYIPIYRPTPKPMLIRTRLTKNLLKKGKKAQRRNAARMSRGRPTRQYLASTQMR